VFNGAGMKENWEAVVKVISDRAAAIGSKSTKKGKKN